MDFLESIIKSNTIFCISLLSLFIGLLISFFTLYQHFLNYNVPRLQVYITRLHIYVPVYSIFNLLIFLISISRSILVHVRDLCEAIAIYSFMCLMLEYCGGVNQCGESISLHPAVLKHFWPINTIPLFYLNEDIPLNAGFVKNCKRSVLQYAFVRVFFSILSLVITPFFGNPMNNGWFSTFTNIVCNISISVALYGLALLYLAIKDHPQLKNANPFFKFIAFKLLIFATYWQGYFIVLFINIPNDHQTKLATLLLLLETPIFCICQRLAYSVKEFVHEKPIHQLESLYFNKNTVEAPTYQWTEPENYSRESNLDQTRSEYSYTRGNSLSYHKYTTYLMKALKFFHIPHEVIVEDFNTLFSPEHRSLVFNNFMAAVNLRDMVTDSVYNFSKNYREHVILSLQEDNEQAAREDKSEVNEQVVTFAQFDN